MHDGPQLSRQKKKPHGKRKNLTAKEKTSRQKEKTSRQREKSFYFCCEVFSFAVTVVGHRAFLILP